MLLSFFVALALPFISSKDLHFSKQGLSCGLSFYSIIFGVLGFRVVPRACVPIGKRRQDATLMVRGVLSKFRVRSSRLNLCKLRDVPMRNRRSISPASTVGSVIDVQASRTNAPEMDKDDICLTRWTLHIVQQVHGLIC
ncbi:hypothetical protein BDZ97DRAFT_111944 [Flammula alnicola]|nr:hypothetical protein BDZ97DRAFT_111944 [Flammula alnicola]